MKKSISNIIVLFHALDTVSANQNLDGYDLGAIEKHLDISDNVAQVKTKGKSNIMSQEIINKLYNAADLFVLPTMGEGFGLGYQEAMACKVPCISTNYSATSEVLADDRGYLVNPAAYIYNGRETRHAVLNSGDLADAIYKVWENPVLQKKLATNGYKWVKNYTPDKVTKRLIEVFEKVIIEDKKPIILNQ